jgi:hypothetical protein
MTKGSSMQSILKISGRTLGDKGPFLYSHVSVAIRWRRLYMESTLSACFSRKTPEQSCCCGRLEA